MKKTLALVGATALLAISALIPHKENVQTYIVRYGTINGTEIITEDGNLWTITDPPLYPENAHIRVLFTSNGTETPIDDEIIDMTLTLY